MADFEFSARKGVVKHVFCEEWGLPAAMQDKTDGGMDRLQGVECREQGSGCRAEVGGWRGGEVEGVGEGCG